MGRAVLVRLAGAGALAALASGLCGFAPAADLKGVLDGRYAAMKAAMAAHDGAAIGRLLSPDFTSEDVSGQSSNAAKMIDEVNRLKPDPKRTSTTTLTAVTRQGDAATVRQRFDLHTTKSAFGGEHKIELVTLSTDTWVKPQAGWLLQRTVTNEVTLTVDGAVVAHKVRG